MITDGQALGYTGANLIKYVDERRAREAKKQSEIEAREERRLEREAKTKELEITMQLKHEEAQLKHEENEAKRLDLESSRSETSPLSSTPAHNVIKLAAYKDNEEIGVFLRNFERVKEANKWSEGIALTALKNAFSGTKVSIFMDTLPPTNYADLKMKLVKSFGENIYELQSKFRFAKQGHEPFSQFVLQLVDNLSRMCTLAEVGTDFDKFKNFMIKDQILRSVDRNLASFLKENNIFQCDLDEIMTIAENYQSIHGRFQYKNKFVESKKDAELFKELDSNSSNSSTSNPTGRVSYPSRTKNSNLVSERNLKSKTSRNCFKCNDPSHLARNCPKSDQSRDPENEIFSISLSKSNDSSLPVSQGKCNGRKVSILRDTGSTAILVKSNLVKPNYFSGKSVNIKFADGRSMSAPKAKVYIKSPYFNGETEAICVDNLPFDVLIGNVKGATCACMGEAKSDSIVEDFSDCTNFACAVQTRAMVRNENKVCKSKVGLGSIKFDLAELTTEKLIELQNSDESLKSCFKKSETISNSFPKFVQRNGVLVRLANSSQNLKDSIQQIILPKSLRAKVIGLAHDTVISGHLGITKTKNRILSHFYWPGITGDVSRYCQSCEICQKNYMSKPPKAPLVNLPIIDTPFARVAIDLIGPLPKSTKGNRFALVAVDMATKYPDAVPLKNIDTASVAEALLDIFSRVGLPRELLHDQGSQFMSSVMKRFNCLLQIKGINTTPYHPSCNGTCENFNKTLKSMIKKICEDEPQIWDKYLQPLLFAYREVPQASTGFSPFELTLGYNVRGPLFLLKEKFLDEFADEDQIPITEYVMNMRNRIKDFLKQSNINEEGSKSKQKYYYDRNTRKRNYKMGDKVLLLLPTSSNKLIAEWKGPYEIVRRLNKVDYVVRIYDKERVYHINMLKPFYERQNLKTPVTNVSYCAANETDSSCDMKTCAINPELSSKMNHEMTSVIEGKSDVFSKIPGVIKDMSYEIVVEPGAKPVSCLPYKIPVALKDQVKSTLEEWLRHGIIRRSSSSWTSPVVVVKNKDETIRLTIDFRRVNRVISTDNFPMPNRDSVIDKLSKAKYLTKLDLTKAFLQMPLSESSRKYTSFVTEFGQFEFCVVPFGIKFASGLCNRVIDKVLNDCRDHVTNFVDDLMVYSDTWDEHVAHVRNVIEKLDNAGITLNLGKCRFAYSEVNFLGVVVGNGKIGPDPTKVEAINNFPKPTSKKNLRSFLGLLSFYRKFVPNLAQHIAPLTNLLSKKYGDVIKWNAELTQCFENAAQLVSNKVMLTIPRPEVQFIVQTDASQDGIGAILAQVIEGEFCPIAFISRKLNSAEYNYSTIEKECLAIKWAVDRFYEYLYGNKFIIRTDHAPLQWLSQNKDKTSRLMRWALALQSYDFVIQYVKGSENFLADAFSRNCK